MEHHLNDDDDDDDDDDDLTATGCYLYGITVLLATRHK